MSINHIKETLDFVTVDATEEVEMYEALERLYQNDDFQKVVLDGYITDSTSRYTELLALERIRLEGLRPTIMEKLVAISHFRSYLYNIAQMGQRAAEDMTTIEDDLKNGKQMDYNNLQSNVL